MRRMRTFEKKEEDRNNILIVMKQAKDWVRPGWVCKRITTSTRNLVHHDLIAMVSGGTLERTAKPFRYAIAGKFQKNQFIKDRPMKISCKTCGVTKTSQWRRKNILCNICYLKEIRSNPVRVQQLPIVTIANNHGRTPKAIDSRIYRLINEGKITNNEGKTIIQDKVPESNNILNEISKLLRLQVKVKEFLNGELTLNQLREECE